MAPTAKLAKDTKRALNSAPEPRPENFEELVLGHIRYSIARDRSQLCEADWYKAVALAVRDLVVERMIATQSAFNRADAKRVYYLSMEFLLGRSLDNNLANLELTQQCREILNRRGIDLDRILD
jgi:starch phosphorylase